MSKYLIHACKKRYWYVEQYLIPSMLEQGISKEDILVYNDDKRQGCLQSFISSAKMISTLRSGTWHLQDDIIISSNFKEMTESYDKGIVCGFCSYYSEDVLMGLRPMNDIWYSFPCIRIPNSVLNGFIRWLKTPEVHNKYRAYIEANKFLDTLFRIYVIKEHSCRLVHNLYPNIVDNVDYLLGGSTINYQRDKLPVSLYFIEKNKIEELKTSLSNTVYKRD